MSSRRGVVDRGSVAAYRQIVNLRHMSHMSHNSEEGR